MHHDIVGEIAVCIVTAWLLGVGAQLLKQPLILAYLLGGFIIGPIGLGLVKSDESIETISSLGLILLLFMIGLEIDLKKIIRAGSLITLTSLIQVAGGVLIGMGIFYALGSPLGSGSLDALYLGVTLSMSSTVIIVKLLYDKREMDTIAGRITLGIMVLQDLFGILFLAVQPNLTQPSISILLLSLAKVALLVTVAFTASRYALPPIFKAVARLPELVVVGALAWCFLVAGMAGSLNLSREMGALVAGVAISTFPYTLDVTAKVTSLRDFFVTLFFVALGMSIPAPTPSLVGWALLFSVVLVVSRFITIFPVLHWLKQGHRASLLPAINLSQVSELGLVILALGAASNHIREDTKGIVAYAFVFLGVASSYGILWSGRISQALSPFLKKFGLRDLDEHSTPEAVEASVEPKVFLLGFSWTASSLLEAIQQRDPALLAELAVVDFNPQVHKELRRRGVRAVYGDLSQRDTLAHAGIGGAEVIVCTLPNTVLKGITNLKLLRQLRALNPTAQIVVHAEVLADVATLYNAGASYVLVPRLLEATELCDVLQAARSGLLDERRVSSEKELIHRNEVVP